MSRFVRAAAGILVVALLQLVLLESGYACLAMSDGSAAGATMAGMTMPGESGSSDRPAGDGQEQAPCEFPWAPNGCQSIAPCAPAAVTVASAPAVSAFLLHDAPMTLVQLAPAAPSRAPELPPPRA